MMVGTSLVLMDRTINNSIRNAHLQLRTHLMSHIIQEEPLKRIKYISRINSLKDLKDLAKFNKLLTVTKDAK